MFITAPLPTLQAWVDHFSQIDLPVLRHTAQTLYAQRKQSDRINARFLSGIIHNDPLLTVRVLAYIEKNRPKSRITDITTIERALVMLGIEPFFAAFANLPLVEDTLRGHPRALLGLLKVINRARHAARWARDIAVARYDLDVEEISLAALLHDVAELLMWCSAPALALEVSDLQAHDHSLRSKAAQKEVYGVELEELQLALAQLWQLPQLLAQLMDRDHADSPRVRNVVLAVDLARHSANGWDDPALPDDFLAIADLLHVNLEAVYRYLGLDENGRPPASANPG